MDPTLLQIEDLPLPNPGFDKYACWEEPLTVSLEMIAGNIVQEERGRVWKVSYSADYLPAATMVPLLRYLRSGRVIATALPDNGADAIISTFIVDRLSNPTLMAFDGSTPIWRGLDFTLREEEPHD